MDWSALVLLAVALTALIVAPGAILLRSLGLAPLAALASGPAVTVLIVTLIGLVLPWGAGTQIVLGALILAGPALSRGARRRFAARAAAVGRVGAASQEEAPDAGKAADEAEPGESESADGDRAAQEPDGPRAKDAVERIARGARRRGGIPRLLITAILAALPAAITHILALTSQMGAVDAVHQNRDSVLHMNLIEEIHRTGNASIISASRAINGAIYPDGYHAIAAVLRPLADPALILSASLISLGAMLLPLMVVLLARSAGLRWWAASLAALLASTTMWMPGYMVFYNAQLAAAMSVELLIGTVTALAVLRPRGIGQQLLRAALGLACLGGISAAHPGGGQVFVIVLCVLGAVGLARAAIRGESGTAHALRARLLRAAACLACLAPIAIMMRLPVLQSMAAYPEESRTLGRTASMSLLLEPIEGQPATGWFELVGALALVGAILMAVRGCWAMLTVWGTLVVLALTTSSTDPAIGALTGAWWRDLLRVLTLIVLIDGVLAAACVQELGIILDRIRGIRPRPTRSWRGRVLRAPRATTILTLCAAICLAIPAIRAGTGSSEYWSYYSFQKFMHYVWLDPEEARAMRGSDHDAFNGAVVYGSPESGASYTAALTDGTSYYRHYGAPINWQQQYLAQNFSKIRADARVCGIIRARGGIPLYYEQPGLPPETYALYPGFQHVDTSKGFVRVADVDGATLWRITACDEEGRTP
ncbi:DUF6541 family protein [Actinomyces gaoshouyii]|uniref:DUF6541 family protein n=1 Tax=Actinomyces gaoshouyii TaxID=1960083 RepID=UPI0009BEFA2C|nr:DUF6541 family protein [Actinomyces gaoshouyii]ARD42249.1 hypothetical protein B6G06_07725 [Actinomyces gaoshouyii]